MTRQSRYIEATDSFEKAIAAQPQPPCLHAEFGFMYWKQQKMEQAKSEFETELKADPGCGVAVLGQAGLQIEEGSYPQALALLQGCGSGTPGSCAAMLPCSPKDCPSPKQCFAEFLAQQNISAKIEAYLYQCLNAAWSGTVESLTERVG